MMHYANTTLLYNVRLVSDIKNKKDYLFVKKLFLCNQFKILVKFN
jgi:hypothetical protein